LNTGTVTSNTGNVVLSGSSVTAGNVSSAGNFSLTADTYTIPYITAGGSITYGTATDTDLTGAQINSLLNNSAFGGSLTLNNFWASITGDSIDFKNHNLNIYTMRQLSLTNMSNVGTITAQYDSTSTTLSALSGSLQLSEITSNGNVIINNPVSAAGNLILIGTSVTAGNISAAGNFSLIADTYTIPNINAGGNLSYSPYTSNNNITGVQINSLLNNSVFSGSLTLGSTYFAGNISGDTIDFNNHNINISTMGQVDFTNLSDAGVINVDTGNNRINDEKDPGWDSTWYVPYEAQSITISAAPGQN